MSWIQLLAQNDGEPVFYLFGLLVFLLGLALAAAALVLWIWALVDAIKNPRLADNERLIWVLVIVLTNWIGAIIYLVVGRKKAA